MSEIIQKWLSKQIGLVVDTTPANFGPNVKDGYMIGTVLYNYGVIDLNQLDLIKVSDSMAQCIMNLQRISEWLHKIGIQCSNSMINFIASGHGSSALRLFYQLYLALEDKYKLDRFKTDTSAVKIENRGLEPTEVLYTESRNDDDLTRSHLELPLVKQKELLVWCKNKYEQEKKNLRRTKEKYKKKHSKEDRVTVKTETSVKMKRVEQEDDFSKFKKQVNKYEEYLRNKDKSEVVCKKMDEIDKANTEGYVSILKERKNKHVFQHNIKDQVQKILLNELCAEVLTKQEKEFNELVARKLMNQSEYEKRMMTKLLEVRHQKHVCIENRRMIDNMINMRQEEEYNKVLLDQLSDVAKVQRKVELENKRTVELHRRLFAERMRKKGQKHYEECMKIVEAFVDLASKTSDYRHNYEIDVPRKVLNQWKAFYYAGLPLYEEIKTENDDDDDDDGDEKSTESTVSYENIVQYVKERDEVLNEQDYYEYTTNLEDWSFEKLPPESVFPDMDELFNRGVNILGHIVHKLLLIKYPIPCEISPADLPLFETSACVVGLDDMSVLPVIQDLLNKRDIMIVEVQTAINYCLEAYRREKIEFEQFLEERCQMQATREQNEANGGAEEEYIVPEEEIMILSEKGLLGQVADEYFSRGEPVPDCYIVDILIEYLKSLTLSKGWVLFDFPSKLSQAVLFEYKVTSRVISKSLLKMNSRESIGYSQTSIPLVDPVDDPYLEIRKSKLISNPHPEVTPDTFETFLSAYIKIKHVVFDEVIEEYMQPDPESTLEQFYTDQGVFYSLLYENNDFDLIKRLVKLIIGDYSLPVKTSVELMGDDIESIENEFGKSKKNVKHLDKKRASHAKKKSLEVLASQHKDQQVQEESKKESIDRESFTDKSITDESILEECCIVIPPEPGDPDWEYVNIPQPSELITILPTFWENTERNYIDELNAFFFLKRTYWSSIVPYVSYIRDHVKTYINRPDNKQDFIFNFQQEYNELDEDLRHDVEVKAEFHCRLSALRNTLWAMCDERAMNAEKERQRLIEHNWTSDQIIALANLFLSAMQLELNRCADTLQLIHDYYLAMLGTKPDQAMKYKKIELSRIKSKLSPDVPKEQKDTKEQKEKTLNQSLKQKRRSSVSINASVDVGSLLMKIFLNPGIHLNSEGSNVDHTLMENYRIALSNLETWLKNANASIDAEKDSLDPKKGSKKGKSDKYLTPSQTLLVTENSEKLFKEWSCVVHYEIKRASVQIELLKENAFKEIKNMFKHAESLFHGLYRDIAQRYDNEVKSVAKLCLVLSKAIEEEIKLQPQLALANDTFLVIGNELLYAIEPRLIPPTIDQTDDAQFSVHQLKNLFKILHYTAPSSSITQKAFVYIFEDLIVINMENSTRKLLPKLWCQVCTYDVSKIITEIFTDCQYIDWRDFIIYNLNVIFPNELQILSTLKKFKTYDPDQIELISYTDYIATELWFEKEMISADNESKIKTIKNILFGMFRFDDNNMNYSDFLLHFCKDSKPIGGFIKAITLVLNSLVCWNEDEGDKFIKIEQEKEIEMKRVLSFSNHLYSEIVEAAMDECDGVVIKEIFSRSNISSSSKQQQSENVLEEDVEEETFSYYDISCMCSGSQSMEECITQSSDFDFTLFLEEKVYYLSFQTVFSVFVLSLPWHLRLQHSFRERIRKELKFVFHDIGLPSRQVYAHQFFRHECVKRLVSITNRFKIVNNADILTKYVQSNIYRKLI